MDAIEGWEQQGESPKRRNETLTVLLFALPPSQTSQDEGGNLFLLGIQDLPWKGTLLRSTTTQHEWTTHHDFE